MRTPDWLTANGSLIPLSQMSSNHIMNVLTYIVRGTGEYGPLTRSGCSGFSNKEWVLLCRTELLRRSRSGQL